MSVIKRNIADAETRRHDVIIVGGGIYGAMLLLEASRRGLSGLLLERSDFGSGTSYNNLRIVHGGLRYLQTLHLSRFFESVSERRWFLREFPELVKPLPCLMPLTGGLMRHPLVLRIALLANDVLSMHRNRDLEASHRLPGGRVLDKSEVRELFPMVRSGDLKGGALWYDAVMPYCHRLQIELLRWATSAGGEAINYAEVVDIKRHNGNVQGVVLHDHIGGRDVEIRAPLVINAAGPGAGAVAGLAGVDAETLFAPSLAWNLLIDRAPLAQTAVALQAPREDSRVYFSHGIDGRMLLGTGHAPASTAEGSPVVSSRQIDDMLEEVNAAVPGLELKRSEVLYTFAGFLPVATPGSVELSDSLAMIDHGSRGGPNGLVSLAGVKYTTARSSAIKAFKLIEKTNRVPKSYKISNLPERPPGNPFRLKDRLESQNSDSVDTMRRIIRDESPATLADLFLRRADYASEPARALEHAESGCKAFGWDAARSSREIDALRLAVSGDCKTARAICEDAWPQHSISISNRSRTEPDTRTG